MYYVVSLHDALCSVLLYEVTCGHGRMMNVLYIVCANVCGMRACFLVCALSYVSSTLPKVQLQSQNTVWSSLLQQYIVQVTVIMAIWMIQNIARSYFTFRICARVVSVILQCAPKLGACLLYLFACVAYY